MASSASRRLVIAVATTAAAVLSVGAAGATLNDAAIQHDHTTHDHGAGRHGGIASPRRDVKPAAFDLVRTTVRREGENLLFVEQVSGEAGAERPKPTGQFAGSQVLSYVWPTTLDPATVGFTASSGVLALAATSHPDFDDTPRYDENHDGRPDNDGDRWHAHWVVLVPDGTRPDGALKVRDIAVGEQPKLPPTWPGVPLFLDSPPYPTHLDRNAVTISVPLADIGGDTTFQYDGVTAALRVNADLHDPLLRVENVFDVASGNLSLPGKVMSPR